MLTFKINNELRNIQKNNLIHSKNLRFYVCTNYNTNYCTATEKKHIKHQNGIWI